MASEPMLFVATSDIAGKTRGKAYPVSAMAARADRGVGWTPTNVQITCFGGISESPFGALGDLMLAPDPAATFAVEAGEGRPVEHIALGDILTLDREPWGCCLRGILKAALARLKAVSGLEPVAAFEHEFQLSAGRVPMTEAYGYGGFRAQRAFCERLMGLIAAAGFEADTIMKEYGPDQYEVTIGPEPGLRAADAAIMVRELTRIAAEAGGERATFTPIRDPASVGNGVHIHMSFRDADGRPATFDPEGPNGLSPAAGAFAAGVLKYVDRILALTAPSVISCKRLTPHRWSAAFNNLGAQDREASLRICPCTGRDLETIARQYNIEYRAADAAASPWLALAALVHAGAQGIEEGLAAPEATAEDLSQLDLEALAARGFLRLPETLDAALARFEEDATVRGWFPEGFAEVYLAHKRGEIAEVDGLDEAALCAAYEGAY